MRGERPANMAVSARLVGPWRQAMPRRYTTAVLSWAGWATPAGPRAKASNALLVTVVANAAAAGPLVPCIVLIQAMVPVANTPAPLGTV